MVMIVLFTIIFYFSVVTYIPYAPALLDSVLVKSWCSLLVPSVRSMSSANYKLEIGLPPMEIKVRWSWGSTALSSQGKR
ncbi:hypothetical protein DPMN_017529 [Dreissena polymorpha]|uniref:Uncharacterized protein n=1 Tax=Dreissena polymorpha TaxID=45954 RepID=A0A9D4NHN0_DREPO|nr:hypothetical protein DPMN_017529 [Dreissena polymorpha]